MTNLKKSMDNLDKYENEKMFHHIHTAHEELPDLANPSISPWEWFGKTLSLPFVS